MKILVTGGAGFIGSSIVDAMLDAGHSVSIIDDLSTGRRENLNPGANLYECSITDIDSVTEVFERERPQVVNHHAAQIDVRRSMEDPVADAKVNVVGSVNLLNLAVRFGVDRFIFASTSAVYSEPTYLPMDESHPIGPQSTYGASKHSAENFVRFFADVHGLRYKIFRYGNVYGPRQNPKGEAGVVAIFTGQLLEGNQPRIFGDGTKTRDYVFVQDVVNANLMAIGEQGDNETFNVSRGTEVSDIQVFEAVRAATGVRMEPRYADKRPGEADSVCLDSTKAKRILRWASVVPLDEGITRSVAYHRSLDPNAF
ncbi:NAD-dependent epimerase/dehydratase family protein [Dehalococcoidia bacterium]|nr:NAD-dependent epimerase/dehydratase family protein [Dehalococcoidia bacterium]